MTRKSRAKLLLPLLGVHALQLVADGSSQMPAVRAERQPVYRGSHHTAVAPDLRRAL